jgi:hypothetical protein
MTVKQFVHAIAIVLFVSSIAFPVVAKGLPRYGVFYYADACISPEGGDSSGNFVKLTHTPEGDRIEFGWSGEGPLMSVAATNVHIDPDGPNGTSKIRFTIPPTPATLYEREPHDFIGTISTSEVELSGLEAPPILPRRVPGSKTKRCRQ